VVAAALDNSVPQGENKLVAIKKVLEPYEHKIITKRILRELHLLKLLKHENIINLKTIQMPMAR
jgi:mitogen-activated protein kinase 1/3